MLGWACERQAYLGSRSATWSHWRIAECSVSAVTNKSMATSDSNLPAVASRSLSAHGRPELCSWCFWRVLWSMHKCSSGAVATVCDRGQEEG